ncbi:hypothetical protein PENTCL1PPCAC_21281, partial [Pristionchus entomophagus]
DAVEEDEIHVGHVRDAKLVPSRESENRCNQLAKRLNECILTAGHIPSVEFNRIHEHVRRSVPDIVQAKLKLSESSTKMKNVHRDLENAIKVAKGIDNSASSIERSSNLLEQCIHLRITQMFNQSRPGV